MNEDARRIMGCIEKEVDLVPKYECKDARLVVREWKYKDQTWLICAYPYIHDNQLQECVLKIRGAFKVHDYLLGLDVPSQTDKKNTLMRFVMPVPGVRVFRLEALSAEQLEKVKAAANLDEMPLDQQPGQETRQIHLPYQGFIYENRPLEADGYKIEVMVIRVGEADLVIRKGDENVRHRIYAGKSCQVVVGGNTLTIDCKACNIILPVGADVEIKATPGVREASCSFQQLDGLLSFQNGLIRFEATANQGGRVITFMDEKSGINHVAPDKANKTGISENTMWYPGAIAGAQFNYEIVANTDKEVVVQLKSRDKLDNYQVNKRFAIKKGEAAWSELVEVTLEGKTEQAIQLRLHPVLALGGVADFSDVFYLPVGGVTTNLVHRPSAASTGFMVPSSGWVGIVDRKQKIALIEQFSLAEITNVYMYMAGDFYTMELFKPKVVIKPGQTEKMQVRFVIIPGMTALDAVMNDLAAALDISAAGLKPEQDIPIAVEVGSALAAEKPVRLELVLMKDGVKTLDIGKWDGVASYDKPVKQSFPLSRKAMSEAGEYKVKLILSDPKGETLGMVEKKM